jgi:hypothetical protein
VWAITMAVDLRGIRPPGWERCFGSVGRATHERSWLEFSHSMLTGLVGLARTSVDSARRDTSSPPRIREGEGCPAPCADSDDE